MEKNEERGIRIKCIGLRRRIRERKQEKMMLKKNNESYSVFMIR